MTPGFRLRSTSWESWEGGGDGGKRGLRPRPWVAELLDAQALVSPV